MQKQTLTVIQISGMANKNGPGLRTMVHLKGCPLYCVWCSTPESQRREPELIIRAERCIGCGKCVESCSGKARKMTRDGIIHDWTLCQNSLECVNVCPAKALEVSGKEYKPEELAAVLKREKMFFDRSGGGVTISGGEPLIWAGKALIKFLGLLQESGISIGMDTTGYADWESIEQVVPFTDFFLWDFKQIDSRKHREYTGVGNEKILENLYKLDRTGTDIYLRCPMIPGYTDDERNTDGILQTASSLNSLKEVHLIPLHYYGAKRYEMLGKEYPLEAGLKMDAGKLEKIKEKLDACNIPCKIV